MKVVVSQYLVSDDFLQDLQQSFPGVKIHPARTRDEEKQEIVDADVFAGEPSREVITAARRLRWIQHPGTGIDWIEQIPDLIASDIILTNTRGPHVNPMADHVFMCLLALTHRLPELLKDQEAHRWEGDKYIEGFTDLTGRTMGILALGDIGMATARRAQGFGMRVLGVDVRPVEPPLGIAAIWPVDRLDDLLRLSDVFVVTAPLTPQTRGLIDRRRLALLRPTAYLIVVSRGGIVDESALADALRSGALAGAGLDVTAEEPLPATSPLWDIRNLIITPHASASIRELIPGRRQILKENLRRYLAGEPLLNVCDKQAGY